MRLSLTGDTVLDVPPLGTIELDTHDGPLALHAQVVALDADVTEDAIAGAFPTPTWTTSLDQVRSLVIRAYLQALVVTVIGASLAVLLVWRRPRWALVTAGATAGLLVLSAGTGAATWEDRALAQPRYTGLLVFVPRVVGDADTIVSNFEEYGQQLGDLVDNVAQLSLAARNLPTLARGTRHDSRAPRVRHPPEPERVAGDGVHHRAVRHRRGHRHR